MTYGLMRVKNEARWLERAITSIQPVCDRILVLDDHSEDDTPKIAARLGCEVFGSRFSGINETRDKNSMLQLMAAQPDWCLMIDGDEALAPGHAEKIREQIENATVDCFSFRVAYLWDSETQMRVDGVYGRFSRPSLWRFRPGQRFRSTGNGGNFHCGNVPPGLRTAPIGATLLHYGYMLREDRIRKYDWYNRIDPGNRVEGCYKHMVIGDLFPADSRFTWGGPLKLEAV